MKRVLLAFTLGLVYSAAAFSQVAKPSPQSTPPDDNDVVKISTNLIQVDVSVTDKKGKIVRDLRRDEIEIYQNGKKQDLNTFSFVSNVRETPEEAKAKIIPGIPAPPPPITPANVKRTIALVVDDLTLSFESTYYVRRALKKFVDEQMQDGDLVAIVRTGAGMGALQQFTTDKRRLYAAIENVKWNPLGTGNIGAFAPLEAKDPNAEPTPTPEAGDRTAEGIEREFNDFRASVFASGSLGAVNYVVDGMSELPGRKSIMLLSDGFKMFTKDAEGFTDSGRVLDAIRLLVDKANRSSVVIYTVDARGLQVTGITAADNTSGRSAEEIQTAESDRRDELLDTQDGLKYLARETGGFAIINNNDISGGIRKVLDDQSYYLLGYIPEDETFDPKNKKYNKLVVKVTRPGLTVRYRSGFFNVEDKAPTVKTAVAMTPMARLSAALVSPFAVTGIGLQLNALFGADVKNETYVRSLLHIDAKDLKFTDAGEGSKKMAFDALAMSFGDNGQVVDQLARSYTLTLKPEAYQRVLENGFVYHFLFPVKKPGAYQYRVAVRDAQADTVGSARQFIEVPNLKKNQLAVSSIVIENLTLPEWQKLIDPNGGAVQTTAMSDTAQRRIKQGTILRYGFEIYNAKLSSTKQPSVHTKIRIFREGKLVLDGEQKPVELRGQTDFEHLRSAGALTIGDKMLPGDYMLQIIITDDLAKAKQQTTSQFVQFEIVQ
ncbi:hypothetical protein BH10ACI2_BH10ACI2_07910 [soil metagenome]